MLDLRGNDRRAEANVSEIPRYESAHRITTVAPESIDADSERATRLSQVRAAASSVG